MTKHVHGGNVYQYKDCIDFSANCNPLGTPQSVKQAIIDSAEHICEYPQVGYEPLKKALAVYEGTEETQVICGNGAAVTQECRKRRFFRPLPLLNTGRRF